MTMSLSDAGVTFNDSSVQPTALTTGTQTIAGAKTFSSAVTIPAANGISGLTITTSQTTPLPGVATAMSYTHGLGVIPVSAELEIVCLTAELGYSIGDVVTPFTTPNASYVSPFSILKNSTIVRAATGNSVAFNVINNSTGVATACTAANWAWRFKVRTA